MINKIIIVIIICLTSTVGLSQEAAFNEYTYTEFFKMIEEEQDSTFKLENAFIGNNITTDEKFLIEFKIDDSTYYKKPERPIVINKAIELTNVHFRTQVQIKDGISFRSGLKNIIFEKEVVFNKTYDLYLSNCVFNDSFRLWAYETSNLNYFDVIKYSSIIVNQCQFNNSISININGDTHKDNINANFAYNTFQVNNPEAGIDWFLFDINGAGIVHNVFDSKCFKFFQFEQMNQLILENNTFNFGPASIQLIEVKEPKFRKNEFNVPTLLGVNIYSGLSIIDYSQFKNKTISYNGYEDYIVTNYGWSNRLNHFQLIDDYEQNHKIQNENYFNLEIEQKSDFYNHFKSKFNTKTSNKIYSEIKSLEAERIAYEHSLNPTFSTFFKLRINQFLKLFSNYGTEPERAVIVSLYVILLFALIYLFFPNSWDKHGKNRIVNRYNFFFKYMKRKAGIHEVYLEDQNEELMSYEQFKNSIADSKQQVPKFFTATALPLYKWAISGTKLSASVLKRVDIMKGSWQDIPKHKRLWKSILLISAFLFAVLYDILIKMLNALMLSINTFTTLGFGEIPIKGLPRYLAIIQGFIGWFMLTIFSVSLISQLLN